MGTVATSFEHLAPPGPVAFGAISNCIIDALRSTESPALTLVFCSGSSGLEMRAIAEHLRDAAGSRPLPPLFLASGTGVIADSGEHEGVGALAGVVLGRGKFDFRTTTAADLNQVALEHLLASKAPRAKPTLLLLRSEGFAPEQLWATRATVKNPLIFGAGTRGTPGLVSLIGGKVDALTGCAIEMTDLSPKIRTAHSFKMLSQLKRITRAEGSMVLELDGTPALDVLETLGSQTKEQSVLFTILANRGQADPMPDILVRGIQGIDPDRKALIVSPEAQEGHFMTFGVRDAAAARDDFQTLCRSVQQELAGALPRFGLYFNCGGRGIDLHRMPHADSRVLRQRFPGMPIAGLQSAFEIAPYNDAPVLQLYTGVLSVFSSPS